MSAEAKTAEAVEPGAATGVSKRQGTGRNWMTTLLPFVLLVLLIIIFTVGNPRFLTVANLWNILRQSSVLLVVAMGGTFVILQASIDLSVGSVVTITGLVTAVVLREVPGVGPWALLLGPAVGVVCGSVNGALFAYGKVPSFLATLGMLSVLEGLGLILIGGSPVPVNDTAFTWISTGSLLGPVPNIGLWALIIFGIATYAGFRTKFGRYMFAIGGGERVTKLAGVNVNRYKLYAFIVCGLLAGLAGSLMTARIGAGTPSMGAALSLNSIAAVVIGGTALSGGVGGPHRTILGVLVMGVLSNGMNVLGVNPYVQISITGVVVIAAVALTLDRSKITIMK
jgi:ribose/xylose/arabinose/galactoside ABC-type transport system permease subunit